MKKLFVLIIALTILLTVSDGWCPPPLPPPIYRDTNCDQTKYNRYGILCQDTDDGKYYKWSGTAMVEMTGTSIGGTPSDGDCALYDLGTTSWVAGTCPGEGTGAPADSNFVTFATDAGLSADLVLTDAGGLDIITPAMGGIAGQIRINTDLTELVNQVWGAGEASSTHTFNVSGSTDPVWTYSDGVANLSAGAIQQGGVGVQVQGNDILAAVGNNAFTIDADVDNADTLVLRAYDVGAGYDSIITLTSAAAPTLALAADGGVTIQGVTFAGGTNTFSLTNGTASLDVAAGATLNIDTSLQVQTGAVTITAQAGGSTLTLPTALSFAGTLTDEYLCNYEATGTYINCDIATTTFQTADATLTALAALTIADVSIIEGTGTDAVAVVTSGGNNYILGSNGTNAALEFKTPANVLSQIGAQATDATLTALAGLTISDVSVIQGTGADAFSVLASGGNNYILGSTSDNTALEFKQPTGSGAPVLGTSPSITTSILPVSNADIGSSSAEWGDVYLKDGAVIKGQADQTATLTSSASLWTANNFAVAAAGQFKLPTSDADPTSTAGYLRHDATITNFTNGGLVYYNGAAIKQLVDMTTATASACTDDQVVAYDAENDLWYCKTDATAAADATLVALAGLTIADVTIIEGTGVDAFNMVASGGNDYFLSSNAGNTALEFKTPAATLAAIGAQATDADLTTLAGLTAVEGKFIIGNATPLWDESAFTVPIAACAAGQIWKMSAVAGVFACAADEGGSTALDDVGDPDAATSITLADTETITLASSSDGETILTITDDDADLAGATSMIDLKYTDDGQANGWFIRGYDNAQNDLKFSIGADGAASFGVLTVTSVTNNMSVFAATTSAQLYGVLSDETGSASGAPLAVFNVNPTLTGFTLAGDITQTAAAYDWDVIDNNASALSIDTGDKAGIINVITTTSNEGVSMSGFLSLGADPADATTAANILMSNATSILFEASAAGTDVNALSVDASEVIQIGSAGASSVTITPVTTFVAAPIIPLGGLLVGNTSTAVTALAPVAGDLVYATAAPAWAKLAAPGVIGQFLYYTEGGPSWATTGNMLTLNYISLGTAVADAGAIRLDNATYIMAEAAPDGTDISIIGVDASEVIQIGASGASGVTITPATTFTGHATFEGVTSTGATGTGHQVFHTAPVFATSAEVPFLIIGSAATAADAGAIRLPNASYIMAEADAAGTDISVIGVDSSEVVQIAASGASGVTITPNTTFTGDITVSGGNINTGAVALVVGDATTTSITFSSDGTGNAEFTFPAGVIGDADLDKGSGAGQIDIDDMNDSATYEKVSADDVESAHVMRMYDDDETGSITITGLSTGRAITFQDAAQTVANLGGIQTFSGAKTFSSPLILNYGATDSGTLTLYEDSTNSGNNYMTVKGAPNLAADTTVFTFPADNGTTGYVLTTDGAGVTSWSATGLGDVLAAGDCASGLCFDGTSDGGTYLSFYDAQGATQLIVGNNTGAVVLTMPITTSTLAGLAVAETFTAAQTMADNINLVFGTSSDWIVYYDETTNDNLMISTAAVAAAEVADPMVNIRVNSGGSTLTDEQIVLQVTDNATSLFSVDQDGDVYYKGVLTGAASTNPYLLLDETDGTDWWLGVDDTGNSIELRTNVTVGNSVKLELDEDGDLFVTGDLTITGDDLFMTTNTAGMLLIADGTNFNPTALGGHGSLAANGTLTVSNLDLTGTEAIGALAVYNGAAWSVFATGATSGHVLKSQGTGSLPTWAAETAAAGGAATNVQYNTGGALDGEAAFYYTAANNTLNITQTSTNPTFQTGDNNYSWDYTPMVGIEGVLEVNGATHLDSTLYLAEATNANMTQGITIQQAGNDDEILSFKSSDVGHPVTSLAEADTYGHALKVSAAAGGLIIRGFSDVTLDGALTLNGVIGATNPTDSHAAILLKGNLNSGGDGVGALGAAETVFRLDNNTTPLITVLGNGATTFAGAIDLTSAGITNVGAIADDGAITVISSGGTVTIESVVFTGGAISAATTLGMSGDLTMSGNTVNLTHSGSTSLTIASTSGTVGIESITFTGDAITGAASLAVGALTGVDSIDATGAVDMDYGSADVTDHTFVSDGGTVIIDGSVTAAAGVNLGTSQALIGTTAMTIGNNGQTVAIDSSDWDIDATGAMTGIGAITSNGAWLTTGTLSAGGAGFTVDADGDTVGKSFTSTGSDGTNRLVITSNTAISPTASTMEIYPEANVWKMNTNGTESTIMSTTSSPAAMVIASQATGDLLYASSGTAWARLGIQAAGYVLGGGATPAWSNAPQITTIELGAATDTTIAREGAGDLTIEGNHIYRVGGTDVSVADGGTGLSVGTEGGIPWFTTTTAIASSALLAANGVMIGGGIDAAPSTITASTTTTHALFATAGAPAFRAVAAGDLPATLTTGTAITSAALTTPVVTTDIHAVSAGGANVGTGALPFASIYIGDAATNNVQLINTAAASAVVLTLPSTTGTLALIDSQVFTTYIEAPYLILGTAATAADAGTIRLPNTGSILAEADAAGTDVNIVNVDASEFINIGSAGAAGIVIGDGSAAETRFKLFKSATNEHWSGITVDYACSGTLAFGTPVYLTAAGDAVAADADAIATMPAIGLVVADGGANCTILTHGVATDTDWGWTIGTTIYVADGAAGGLTATVGDLSDTNDVVQIVGIAIHADSILVMPSLNVIVLE